MRSLDHCLEKEGISRAIKTQEISINLNWKQHTYPVFLQMVMGFQRLFTFRQTRGILWVTKDEHEIRILKTISSSF